MGHDGMRCITMRCADKEVCKVKDGVKGCFPFKPATCRVYGDPHYITYDGMAYDFQGGCSYTLTTTCAGESAVQFSVIGYNMYPTHQNFTRAKLQAVALQVEDLYLTLNQSGEVYVSVTKSLQLHDIANYPKLFYSMRIRGYCANVFQLIHISHLKVGCWNVIVLYYQLSLINDCG